MAVRLARTTRLWFLLDPAIGDHDVEGVELSRFGRSVEAMVRLIGGAVDCLHAVESFGIAKGVSDWCGGGGVRLMVRLFGGVDADFNAMRGGADGASVWCESGSGARITAGCLPFRLQAHQGDAP